VNRVGENTIVGGEDAVGAVALVGVGIDYCDTCAGFAGVEGANGDGDVVEHAVSEAPIGKRVMGAVAEVAGEAVGKRRIQGGQRAAHFEAGAEQEGFACGKTQFNRFGGVE
jgi:2C-methyl-D-erythritol 2,4-cyclodiphosphate synthase